MQKIKNIWKGTTVILAATVLIMMLTSPTLVNAAPTVLLYEDFEAEQFPPAGWTIYNQNGGYTWELAWGNAHSGTGSARCRYESDATQNDDWLVTKGTVVASGGEFSLWAVGYSNAMWEADEFEIYMSTTGNTITDFLSGTLLQGVYYPNVPTVWTEYSFDISSYEGETVWFAVRYIGDYAWYIWVDDVTLPDGTTEDFEPWPGWSQEAVSGTDSTNYWSNVQTGGNPACSPHSGSWMATYQSYWIYWDNSARLKYDTPFNNVISVDFWMYHNTGSDSYVFLLDSVTVCVSTDGATWTNVETFYRYDGTDGWAQHSVDLSAYTASCIYIGFLAESDWGMNIYIDDVTVTGGSAELTVDMDIKPGGDPNSVNLEDQGVLTVAVLGSEDLDAACVDPSTVELDGVSLATRGKMEKLAFSLEDINLDGYDDFVAKFNVQDLVDADALDAATTELELTGELYNGTPILGTDTVNIVPPQ